MTAPRPDPDDLAEALGDVRNVAERLRKALPGLVSDGKRHPAWPDTPVYDAALVMARAVGTLEGAANLLAGDNQHDDEGQEGEADG